MEKEQEVKIEEYYTKVLQNGTKCKIKTNIQAITPKINNLYEKYLEINPPQKIVLVDSPEAAIREVAKSTGEAPKDISLEILWVSYYTWWVAYYYAGMVLLNEPSGDTGLDSDLISYEDFTHNCYALLPCENVCFVIEYPKSVAIKDNDLEKFELHKDGALALEFNDGTGFAWLNGVEVPDWLATTPASKLDVKKIIAETNTDIRREGIKKVGIAVALKKLKAIVIDKLRGKKAWEHYDLLECNFGDKPRKFLKMKNPSTGDFVIEQVDISCKTVSEACAMRTRETSYISPVTIT